MEVERTRGNVEWVYFPSWTPYPDQPQPNYITPPQSKGWECPKCGTIYAPWVSECKKEHKPFQIWTNTTKTEDNDGSQS